MLKPRDYCYSHFTDEVLKPRHVKDASQKHTVRDDGEGIHIQTVCMYLYSESLPVLSLQFENLKLWYKLR